ncbi:MAG TPA: type VI secretion system-associated protein TagF [Stellaceae bacterium]|nr:type VI secretion system-associated protein TagF [Stellaceae bacterium]
MALAPRLGFFGKLPARGDFVTRRLTRDFTDPWDGWLQDAIAMSTQQLGEEWLDTYLTAPIWRFLISPGICGPLPMLGVMMPSVDRVGRYFPLTLAVTVADCMTPAKAMLTAGAWFDEVEQLALSALEDDADLDRIDQQAEAIAPPLREHPEAAFYRTDRAVSVELGEGDGADAAAGAIDGVLGLLASRYTLWWTSGSDRCKPSLVFAEGLPSVERFAALLDGKWEQWGWKTR